MAQTVGPRTLPDLQLCLFGLHNIFLSNLFFNITYFPKNAQIIYVQLNEFSQILNTFM